MEKFSACNFTIKGLLPRCFQKSKVFQKKIQNSYSTEHLWVAASECSSKAFQLLRIRVRKTLCVFLTSFSPILHFTTP